VLPAGALPRQPGHHTVGARAAATLRPGPARTRNQVCSREPRSACPELCTHIHRHCCCSWQVFCTLIVSTICGEYVSASARSWCIVLAHEFVCAVMLVCGWVMVQGNKNPRIRIAVVDGDAMVEEEFSEIQRALTSSGAFTYVNRATVRNLGREPSVESGLCSWECKQGMATSSAPPSTHTPLPPAA
jgi:hypothetical protein